jgi:hypothetical protein
MIMHIEWRPSRPNTNKQAHIDEALRIRDRLDGKPLKGAPTYNQRNSPGKKDLKGEE